MDRNLDSDYPVIDLRIGVDIGGTFTDFVVYNQTTGAIATFKLMSTPQNPAEAVLSGLAQIAQTQAMPSQITRLDIIHGSTVATNALLERKGARTAFITTSGFGDLLQIGRQNRPALYDLFADPAPSLAPPELRFELNERVDCQGRVIQALDPAQVEAMLSKLGDASVESVAVCFLFSFLHPEHEQAVAEILRRQGYPVSASNEILAEFREVERASTTMVNAYVSPVLDRYLSRLENEILDRDKIARLRVMQSNGGNMSIDEVRRGGVHCILSGPAGGVVGAGCIARLAQIGNASERTPEAELPAPPIKVISFDMGGTSTDAALIDGEAQITTEAVVSGCPIHIPMLDIHTIGAGGGSIALIDKGGALRVGPESAGADPGPACYGRGDLPTVTDANLVLGRLAPDYFLGGKMILDRDRAQRAVAQLAEALGLGLLQTALGIVEVVNAHMERALRVISVERGHDPRQFTLLSFGGAGGLHAVDLARRLGVRLALVPPLASTLSAFGMLNADVIKDSSQTVMLSGETGIEEIAGRFTALISNLKKTFDSGATTTKNTRLADLMIEMLVDMRYQGQSYELTIPFTEHLHDDFHQVHRKVYGFAREKRPVELVNLRVRLVQRTSPLTLPESAQKDSDPSRAWLGHRPVVAGREHGFQEVSFYRGEDLCPGNRLVGPAVVLRKDTTIFLGGTDLANVDRFGNLLIEVGE